MSAASALALAAICARAPDLRAQVQGGGSSMGNMMGGGNMASMRTLMSWTQGTEINAVPTEPKPEFNWELRARGNLLYGQHCEVCHGANGDGNGRRASELSPPPRNFAKGVYEFRSTPTGTLPMDEDIWKVISDGLHGTAMVPWMSLPENDRWALVAFVEGFSPRFSAEKRNASITVPSQPAETPQLIAQGRKLFSEAGCVECHGKSGHGDGTSVPSLKDSAGRPIAPLDFANAIFRRSSSLADIFLSIRTGLDGTPMPSYTNSLSADQTWAVAAYVRSLGAADSVESRSATKAREQERLGMAIDMPGMIGMPMGGMMQ
jgi:mono/diheme cytochrome c family protein